MPDAVTARELGELLAQLSQALGKPFKANADKLVATYHRTLEDWPREAIEWAIWRACKTATKWPKPAELIALCHQSPHKKIEPAPPAEPEVNEGERCRECREWWGYHRVVLSRDRIPVLLTIQMIRHRTTCHGRRFLDRFMQVYGYSWVDGPPDAGRLEPGGQAWKVSGVLQLISPLPDPPTPATPKPPSQRLDRRAASPITDVGAPVQTSASATGG